MTIEEITKGRSSRVLFDFLGHQFSYTKFEDKILTLKELHKANLLDKTLRDYKKRYDTSGYHHVYSALQRTLIGYISFLKVGQVFYYVPKFNDLPLKEVISELKMELEKFDNDYSYEKLISAYVSNNEEEYRKQSTFFQVDLDEDITEKLKIWDEKEDRPYYLSYIHLYKFLKDDLLKDFKKNEFKGYRIDMGMAPQMVKIIKKYLQKPDRESYLQAIEFIIKKIY